MKRKGNLYEQIYSLENLYLAEKNARKGKKYQKQIREFSKNRDNNILELHNALRNEEYKVSKYSVFTIFDKKERQIFVLPYKDRVIQHAILQIINPIFNKCFISQTYSCIKNKGIHKAYYRLKKYLKDKENTKYCLFLDVKKYYPNINKTTLKQFLRRKFKDRKLLNLLDGIIDSHNQGIPIGSYLSQIFGNFYLTYFDHWIKSKKVIYLKYMDNIIILHKCKQFLHNLRIEIETYLFNILDLQLSTYQVFPVSSRGIDFVGYKLFHTHSLLRKSIKTNFIKMIKNNPNKESISSYLGWTSHSNSINLTNKYLNNDKTTKLNT